MCFQFKKKKKFKYTIGPLHGCVYIGRYTSPPGQIVRIAGIHLSFNVVVAPVKILSNK